MIHFGKTNLVNVIEIERDGFQLECDDGELIFMPRGNVSQELAVGDKIKVFVYVDPNLGAIATSQIPVAELGQFAALTVKSVTSFGAFLDWGISKDLLVPDTEMKEPMNEQEVRVIRICLDENTDQIYGTEKFGKYLEQKNIKLAEKERVSLLVYKSTDIGFRVIVNDMYYGIIYHNETFVDISVGQKIAGVVKKVRADGLVDTALQPHGLKNIKDGRDKILTTIKDNEGFLKLNDKSDPDEIREILGMSKKTFKRSIGMLYKSKIIEFVDEGIKLIGDDS